MDPRAEKPGGEPLKVREESPQPGCTLLCHEPTFQQRPTCTQVPALLPTAAAPLDLSFPAMKWG